MMLTFLSRHKRGHVACCQNGIIELAWDEVEIHLRPANFTRLIRLLEIGIVELDLVEACDGPGCRLKQVKLGYFQLQLGRTRFDLSLMDFLDLAEMARAAARRLARTGQAARVQAMTV
jgi:hypothetical protein